MFDAAVPWLTFDAADELLKRLPSNPVVFEYGSGASTLFWLKHGARCTSVEHDEQWYAQVRQRVGDPTRLDYRLVLPEPAAADGDPTDPRGYRSTAPAFRHHAFMNYARQIDEFPDEHFDVVLVDGRARPSCLMHAAPKVKRGGFLVLDNAERDYYTAKTSGYLNRFSQRQFFGVGPGSRTMWRTDIYQRQ